MRICSPQLGLSPDARLGGEVHDREILKALAALGVEVDIILPFGKKHESITNWKIWSLPTPFVYPPALFNFLIIPYLFWIYFHRRFSVLRVHSPQFVGLGAIFFHYFAPSVKLAATFHHYDPDWFSQLVTDFVLRNSNVVVVGSQATKEEVINRSRISPDKIVVIHHGINLIYKPQKKDKELINRYNLTGKKVLLYLGQLIPRKNLDFIFAILPLLPKNYVFLIGGEGNARKELAGKVKSLHLDEQVIFAGYIPEDRKVKFFNLADVYVFPSVLEGFGLSLTEAMACGRPVIVADYLTAGEIVVNNQTGNILPLKKDLWVEKIIELSAGKSLRVSNAAARSIRQKFTWGKAAQKYLEIVS